MVQNALIVAAMMVIVIVGLVVFIVAMKPCLPGGNGLTIGGGMLLAGCPQR